MEQRVPSARSSRSSAGPAILRLSEPCIGGTRAVQARAQSRHEGSPHPEGSLASHLRLCPRLRPKGCIFAVRAEPPPAGKRRSRAMSLSRRDLITASALLLAGPAGALRAADQGAAAGGKPIVLCWNENPYGPSPAARLAVSRAIADGCRYPDDDEVDALEGALAAHEQIDADSIVTVTGSGALREHVVTIVDEAYMDFTVGEDLRSVADLVQGKRRVVVLRTFSKIHGMAGLRFGYAITRPDLAETLEDTRMTTPNIYAVRAARASLDDKAFLADTRRRILASRTRITTELGRLGLKFAEP